MSDTEGTPHIPETLPFLKLEIACVEIVTELNGLAYDSNYYPHLVSVALLNNCIETAFAMVILSRGPTDGGHPILLRTLFESTARLMFIAKSPEDNALALERKDCEEILRQIGKCPTQDEDKETTEIRKMACERVVILDKEKVKSISTKELIMQGKLAPYYPIYQQLSGVVHGQVTPLLQCQIVMQNDVVHLKVMRSYPEEQRLAFQEMATTFLQLAQLNIQRVLDTHHV